MRSQHRWFKQAILLIPLLIGSANISAFPEIPFCPLGGPTGWWNRMTDDDDHRYYPPPYYRPPAMTPYWNSVRPYGYYPRYPVYPSYLQRQ
jgi:hypothetical protein